ncbi:MAG TPA: hypothetical protein VF017_15790 [Thermoanaerobaculia bacterium]|nr:hypothetical protein [Thermoanaerobaculia bacterium]
MAPGYLTQQLMNRVFDVTDELDLDREQITVPLLSAGEGEVRRLAGGKIEITLPEADDLEPFFAGLAERLRAYS